MQVMQRKRALVVCLLLSLGIAFSTPGTAQGWEGQYDDETPPPPAVPCESIYSDVVDADQDGLSDLLEDCFLGTSVLKSDTDGDGIVDGFDATPAVPDLEIPLVLRFAAINEVGGYCDPASTWDPFFTAASFHIDALQESSQFHFETWTAVGHLEDRSRSNNDPAVIQDSGTGVSTVTKLSFALDPDLQKWNGGLETLKLDLAWGAVMIDHDHGRVDDVMAFETQVDDILQLGTNPFEYTSEKADDGSGPIDCKAQVKGTWNLLELDEAVLDTAQARLMDPGTLIGCAHPQVNDCILDGNWG